MFDDGKARAEVEGAVAAFAATRVEAAFLSCLAGILAGAPDEFPAAHSLTIAPFSAIIKLEQFTAPPADSPSLSLGDGEGAGG